MQKRLTTTLGIGALVGVMVATSATSVLAGERKGNGGAIEINAKSECAYSGLEDFDFLAPVQPGVVQNWGHAKDAPFIVESRGASHVVLDFGGQLVVVGCNAHLHPIK